MDDQWRMKFKKNISLIFIHDNIKLTIKECKGYNFDNYQSICKQKLWNL